MCRHLNARVSVLRAARALQLFHLFPGHVHSAFFWQRGGGKRPESFIIAKEQKCSLCASRQFHHRPPEEEKGKLGKRELRQWVRKLLERGPAGPPWGG